jgi:hypothetical protein
MIHTSSAFLVGMSAVAFLLYPSHPILFYPQKELWGKWSLDTPKKIKFICSMSR